VKTLLATCQNKGFCPMHHRMVRVLERSLAQSAENIRQTKAAAAKSDAIERRFLVMQKDQLAVVVDLQASSARSTEQLARYNTTLMEILFTLKELQRDRISARPIPVSTPTAPKEAKKK
jgi:hypothetical protein